MRTIAALVILASISTADAQVGLPWPGPGTPASSGSGGPSLVTHVGGTPSSNTGFTSAPVDTSTSTLLVASCSFFNGSSDCALADSKTNTWVGPISTLWRDAAGSRQIYMWYAYTPTVGTGHTFTFSCSPAVACFPSGMVLAFKGTVGTTVDQSNGTASGVGGASPGSITPTANNEVVVSSALSTDAAASFSVDSSMTITDQTAFNGSFNEGGAAAYIVQGTAGAINPTWSGPAVAAAAIASFK